MNKPAWTLDDYIVLFILALIVGGLIVACFQRPEPSAGCDGMAAYSVSC